jgi:PAS domain S-box-containing protein
MLDLRWILERLPVGVWVAQVPAGEVTYANPEFRTIMGMDAVPESRASDAPQTYGIFDRTGSSYPVDKLPFSRVVASGQAASADDIVVHRADGRKINVQAFAYPAFDADGKLSHVVVAFIDITQQVKAELSREQTEARLALAVNHAPIAIWAADMNGVVTLSEGAGLASLGVQSGELVGQNLFELYRDHPSIPGHLRRGLAGESFWYTVQVGKAVYDTWLTPIRDAGGEIVGISGLSNDVSEIRRLQANAIQNDRAIALGTLGASVAHEINNPLTYMLGNLELTYETLARMDELFLSLPEPARRDCCALTAEMRKALDPVRAGTERIAAITRELRTFSRPATEETSRVDVRSVVESVLKLVRKELEARARLNVTLGQTAPVIGNSARLVQVVMNLVVNAMQAFTGDRTDRDAIWIRTRNEGAKVVIEVADSGPGVPPEDRERVFEPFVTTKHIGQGTGLGLFVCRNIVREVSGKVTVGDRPGGGALFRVELPAAQAAGPPQVTAAMAPTVSEPSLGHVLIIEDDPLLADILSLRLSSAGYRASVELDPGRALETLAAGGDGFDLVYCDLMMQRMSGMELAEALSARAPSQMQKLVFMTGGAFTPRAQAFRDRHADQYVDKPFDILKETSRRLNRYSRQSARGREQPKP